MTKKRHDYSTLLIWAAALVTVARYAAAFIASDLGSITGWVSEAVTIAMGITGLGMGILDTVGGAYLFDGWRRSLPKAGGRWAARFIILTVLVFAIILTGLFILTPFTVSRVTHSALDTVLGGKSLLWWWGIAVNAAPYLLICGVMVGTSGIVSVNQEKPPESKAENSGNLPENVTVTKPRWNRIPKSEYTKIARMSTAEICLTYGTDERTARNWRVKAQEVK